MNETTLKLVTIVAFSLAADAPAQMPPPTAITLRQAAELALARAPDLAAAQATARERAASARLAGDELRPQAWLMTTPGYAHGLPVAIAGSVPAVAGVAWRTTLYDRATRVEALQREAESHSAAGRSERTRIEVVRDVLIAFSRCWEDDRIVAAVRQRQEAAGQILEHTLVRHAAGRCTELEVEQARLNLARARMRALDLETERDLDRLELSRLTGAPATQLSVPPDDPLGALPDLPHENDIEAAQAADPELSAAARSIALLSTAADLAAAPAGPVVQAEAQYARLSRANHYDSFYRRFVADDWSVGISVVLPLWSGGRHGDAAARAAASLERMQNERRSRASALEMQTRRAIWSADRTRAGVSLAREATAVAQEALRIADARAKEGRGDIDEVEHREIGLADAEEDEVRSEASYFAARVELLALRGDLEVAVLGPAAPAPQASETPTALPANPPSQ
jgi:multidrug efflux system outer membrane protein